MHQNDQFLVVVLVIEDNKNQYNRLLVQFKGLNIPFLAN